MNLELFGYAVLIILEVYVILSSTLMSNDLSKEDIFILIPSVTLAIIFYYQTMDGLATFLICK